MQNACDVILAAGRVRPEAHAIHAVDTGGMAPAVTHGELAHSVDTVACALRDLGVAPDDRVILLVPDSPLFCATFLAIIKLGAVAIPVNPRLAPADCAFICADSAATLVIVAPEYADAALLPPGVRSVPSVALARAAPPGIASVPRRPHDIACALYSSGTTGRPKGILHTHATVARSGELHREVLGSSAATRVFSTSKLFFAFPLENAFLGPVALGATTLIHAAWPEPEQVVAAVRAFRPDVFFTVPTMIRRLLGSDLSAFRSVTHCYTGGERLPDTVANAWESATGVPIRECYGTSETFCNVFAQRAGSPRGACGEALPHVQTKLLDHAGNAVGASEPGVLWLRMPTLAARYTNAQVTASAFRDGWFCTNDMFTVDASGAWFHQGRADELMKVAGQWVKPAEIEAAALETGAIRDAACVVLRDRDGFDRLALFIVPAHTDAVDRIERALGVKLARHSQPKWIRAVDELPRTATGKIQRFRLRKRLQDELDQGTR